MVSFTDEGPGNGSYPSHGLLHCSFLLLPIVHRTLLTIMRITSSALTLLALGLSAVQRGVQAATWTLTDTVTPSGYNDAFDYFNDKDPTNGLVLYQTQADAAANNLTGVSNGRFYMRVDTTEVQSEGRRSVRLSSKKSYNDGVYV